MDLSENEDPKILPDDTLLAVIPLPTCQVTLSRLWTLKLVGFEAYRNCSIVFALYASHKNPLAFRVLIALMRFRSAFSELLRSGWCGLQLKGLAGLHVRHII